MGGVNRRLCEEFLECLSRLGPGDLFALFGRSDDRQDESRIAALDPSATADAEKKPPIENELRCGGSTQHLILVVY
jgi:hypothetical protein